MEADLAINETIVIPGRELSVSTSRSSGPGGQHVQKTSSKVTLRWNIADSKVLSDAQKARVLGRLKSRLVGDGEIIIHVESERSQHRNREIARERLAEWIKKALRPKTPRIPSKPTLASKIKRITGKKKRGLIKKLRKSHPNEDY